MLFGLELIMKKIDVKKLAVALVIPQLAGGIGAVATTPKIQSWYAHLNKPFFNPPSWVFGPVWTLLFLMMGVSLFLVWSKKKKMTNWYWIQLGLNTFWSFLFFYFEQPGLALIEIMFLWWAILMTIKDVNKTSRMAGRLLAPYLFWVSFATMLNGAIWWLNR